MRNLCLATMLSLALCGCYSSSALTGSSCYNNTDCDDGNPLSADICGGDGLCRHATPLPPDTEETLYCDSDADCRTTPFDTRVCRDGRCASISSTDPPPAYMHEDCDNGVDDDSNDLVDCDDPFCFTFEGC